MEDSFPTSPFPPPSFTKALTAGLLTPTLQRTRSNPTLLDMMSCEPDHPIPSSHERQLHLQKRLLELTRSRSTSNNHHFNDFDSADVRLNLTSTDGLLVTLNLHRNVLVKSSRFFESKLSDYSSKKLHASSVPHLIDISDCNDVEAYVDTIRLMYCGDIRRRLIKEDVPKVLSILKVSASIVFDAGVLACLEYLEAAPWAEDEEEKVASVILQLRLDSSGAGEVLKRVSLDIAAASAEETGCSDSEEILVRLLQVVLEGKDEKARRDMKGLVSKMLRENSTADLSKESLYSAVNQCLCALRRHFARAVDGDVAEMVKIARQADNLHWMLEILIERQIAEEFLRKWAGEAELAGMHAKVQALHRYEVSRVTSRLFVGIGKGQILVSKETRCLLLKNWLEAFYEDFGWMRKACKGLDRHVVEEGLASTVLTLPLAVQQEVMLAWFDRFLNCGDDCPNIQKGFEVWWRRAFWRRNGERDNGQTQLKITAVCDNSR